MQVRRSPTPDVAGRIQVRMATRPRDERGRQFTDKGRHRPGGCSCVSITMEERSAHASGWRTRGGAEARAGSCRGASRHERFSFGSMLIFPAAGYSEPCAVPVCNPRCPQGARPATIDHSGHEASTMPCVAFRRSTPSEPSRLPPVTFPSPTRRGTQRDPGRYQVIRQEARGTTGHTSS